MKNLKWILMIFVFAACSSNEFSQSDLKAPFVQNRKQAERCYQKALKRRPDLQGTVELKFLINKDGKSYKTIFRKNASTIKDKRLNSCLKKTVDSWQFPKGHSLELIYPFHFENQMAALSDESMSTPVPTPKKAQPEPANPEATALDGATPAENQEQQTQ